MNFGLRQDARVTSRSHLSQTRGILQADGYKGYAKLYDPGPNRSARFREAACWAHLRRDFHDVWTSTGSEIAREALDWIGALYDIERDITGKPADVRRAARQAHSLPKVEAFRAWAELQLTRLGFRNTCTEVELAHLHGHEGRARPPVGFLLAQQRPDQRGDLARGGDACNVLALAPRVHHTGHS